MDAKRLEDLRAVAFGTGLALLAYYGHAAIHVALGAAHSLDRPVTWLGLAAGTAVVTWSRSRRVRQA